MNSVQNKLILENKCGKTNLWHVLSLDKAYTQHFLQCFVISKAFSPSYLSFKIKSVFKIKSQTFTFIDEKTQAQEER